MQMAADETRQYFEDPTLWDREAEPYQVQMRSDLARLLPPGTAAVLDAACGNGLVSAELRGRVALTGVDGSLAALRHFAGTRCQGRLEALPFADGAFDLVMANDVVEHLPADVALRVRDELFRVARHHVLITVPFLEDIAAGRQTCPACGATTHRNRHERSFDLEDLARLTPAGWRLALFVLSGAEWDDVGPEVEALRRVIGSAPAAPAQCAECGARPVAAAAASELLTTAALLAGVDVQNGVQVGCRTEVIACFHREGAADPWAKIGAGAMVLQRVVDPMAVEFTTAGESLFRRAFVPSTGHRGYYCAPGAQVNARGLRLDAAGVAEVKVGHFARGAGTWRVSGEAEGKATLRIQHHGADGFRFVTSVPVEGSFDLELAEVPPPGPFGRLAVVRVDAGTVRLRECRLTVPAIPQEFVAPGTGGFVRLSDATPALAVGTAWYGADLPLPAALMHALRVRRAHLATAAGDTGPVAARAALLDGVVARVAGGTGAALSEARQRIADLERELTAVGERARATAIERTRLAAEADSLGARLAIRDEAVADMTARLGRVRYAEYAVNALRGLRNRLRRLWPARPAPGTAASTTPEPRTAVMLVPDDRIDRRVLLQARSLVAAGWNVRVVGAPAPTPGDRHDEDAFPEVEIVRVDASAAVAIPEGRRPPRVPDGERDWSDFYWLTNHYYLLATERPFQVVVAHDLPVLPAAAMAAARLGAKLAYDAHELYPEQHHFGEERRERYRRAETKLAPLADLTITVNASIAQEMARRYGIAEPAVILNCPDLHQALPIARGDELRTALGIPAAARILLFLGSLSLNRNLEGMVAAMAKVRRRDVAFVLVGPGAEKRAELEGIAREHGVLGSRVFFHPPVAQADVLRYTAAADAGVIPYPHVDLNSELCTPNKLFDFLVVGLPILANDSPELRRFVAEQGVGMVWPFTDAASIAAGIDAFFAQDHGEYHRRLAALGATFTWQQEGPKAVRLYEQLITAGGGA